MRKQITVGEIQSVNAMLPGHLAAPPNTLRQFLIMATNRHDMNGTSDPNLIRTWSDQIVECDEVAQLCKTAPFSSDADRIVTLMHRVGMD